MMEISYAGYRVLALSPVKAQLSGVSLRPKNRQKMAKYHSWELLQIMCGVTDDDLEPHADKRHGTIDGVEVDMRHELLNPSEWYPQLFPLPASSAQLFVRAVDGPFIWFPRFGRFSARALERKAKKVFSLKAKNQRSREANAQIVSPKFDEYVRFNTPECIVLAGDKICVDGVEIGHNPELRYARLRVERSNGEVQILPTRLSFKPIDNIIDREDDISLK